MAIAKYQPITWHQGQSYNPDRAFGNAIQGGSLVHDQAVKFRERAVKSSY